MTKKRLCKLAAGLFLATMLIVGGWGEVRPLWAAPAKVTIRLSHAYPVTYIRHKSALKFKELLEKESNGEVEVKVFPSGQLQKGTGEMDAMILGNVDMIATHGGRITTIVPLWDLFVMPFFWPNNGYEFEAAWKFKQDERVKRILFPKLEQKGVKTLGFVTALGASASFSTVDRPVRKIEDFKGLKMNTSAGWLRYEAVKALGASCVSLAQSEVATALSQGTIDGEFGTTTNVLASGFPTKYIHWWPSWCNDTGSSFLMNMKKWNSLPDNIKKIISTSVMPQVQAWTNKEVLVEEAASVPELKKRGKVFIEPDPGTLEEAKKRIDPVLDAFAAKYGADAKEMVAIARELLTK